MSYDLGQRLLATEELVKRLADARPYVKSEWESLVQKVGALINDLDSLEETLADLDRESRHEFRRGDLIRWGDLEFMVMMNYGIRGTVWELTPDRTEGVRKITNFWWYFQGKNTTLLLPGLKTDPALVEKVLGHEQG